jgi:Protein of unknown function (DUF1559)
MSLMHRLVCCLLSMSIALPAGPMAAAAQKSKAPATKSAQKAPFDRGVNPPVTKRPASQPKAPPSTNGATQSAAPLSKSIDLRHVQRGAFAVVVLHPRAFFEASGMELFPREVVTAAGMKEFGIDPTKIDRAVLSFANFDPPREPTPAAVILFSEPIDQQKALAPLKLRAEETNIDGKKVWVDARTKIAIHHPNDRTIVVAAEPALKSLLAGGQVEETPFAQRLKQTDFAAHAVVVVGLDPIRKQLEPLVAQAPPLPPPFSDFIKIPELTSAVEMRALIGGSPDFQWIVHARDEQAAAKLEELINQGLMVGKEMILAQMNQQFQGPDPVQQAGGQYFRRLVDHFAGTVKPTRSGNRVTISVDTQGGWATVGILVALLLPATQAAREAARRTQSMNNLKQISLALLNHEAAHKEFPAQSIADKQGKPLLSWRVAILPFIEEAELHSQFHLDEPWDSEHNKTLIDRMPAVYQNPNLPPSTNTSFLAPVGVDSILGSKKPARIKDIKDGLTKTILLLEADADRAVPWTKPEDYEVDAKSPLAGLGHLRPNGIFGVAMGDGSVRTITNEIDPEAFLLLLKKADGQAVQVP